MEVQPLRRHPFVDGELPKPQDWFFQQLLEAYQSGDELDVLTLITQRGHMVTAKVLRNPKNWQGISIELMIVVRAALGDKVFEGCSTVLYEYHKQDTSWKRRDYFKYVSPLTSRESDYTLLSRRHSWGEFPVVFRLLNILLNDEYGKMPLAPVLREAWKRMK